MTRANDNHPKTLGTEDAPALLASGAHWARRRDLDEDAKLCDIPDEGIRRGPAKQHITRLGRLRPLAG
jgi:hypothetical protein